jgi:hypothetical protein
MEVAMARVGMEVVEEEEVEEEALDQEVGQAMEVEVAVVVAAKMVEEEEEEVVVVVVGVEEKDVAQVMVTGQVMVLDIEEREQRLPFLLYNIIQSHLYSE